MTTDSLTRRHALGGLLMASLAPGMAFAQAPKFPNDTVRMVVPYAAGGATDIVALSLIHI